MRGKQKPKFRVGERVKTRSDFDGSWLYGNVLKIDIATGFITVGLEYHEHQCNYRKLSAKEIGPRPRGKGRK